MNKQRNGTVIAIFIIGIFLFSLASVSAVTETATINGETVTYETSLTWSEMIHNFLVNAGFSTVDFSIIGDKRQCGDSNGDPQEVVYETTGASGGSFSVRCSDASCSPNQCLIDLFRTLPGESTKAIREYKNSFTLQNNFAADYRAEIYCCPFEECSDDSDCEDDIGPGSECVRSTQTDSRIPYSESHWHYCTIDPTNCWFRNEAGTCEKREYYNGACPTSYSGFPLFSSQSACSSSGSTCSQLGGIVCPSGQSCNSVKSGSSDYPSTCCNGAGNCVISLCSTGQTAACDITNGVGKKTCTSPSNWGTCTVQSCNSGYTLSGNACVANGGINCSTGQTLCSDGTCKDSCGTSDCSQQGGTCMNSLLHPGCDGETVLGQVGQLGCNPLLLMKCCKTSATLNNTGAFGEACTADSDCLTNHCDKNGWWIFGTYKCAPVPWSESKKVAVTREQISTMTTQEKLAFICLTSNQCISPEGTTSSCVSVKNLHEDGTIADATGFLSGTKSTIDGTINGAVSWGIGGALSCGFVTLLVGGICVGTATVGCVALPAAIGTCAAVTQGAALIGAGVGYLDTQAQVGLSDDDPLVKAVEAQDDSSVGICVAESSSSYCKYTSWAAFFPITKNKCTDGLIILLGALVLIVLLFKR